MRGWDYNLRERVKNAYGDCHYLDDKTLQYFNSYAGKHLPTGDKNVVKVVESIRYDSEPREYRVVTFTFMPATKPGFEHRENVTITKTENNYPTASQAIRADSGTYYIETVED